MSGPPRRPAVPAAAPPRRTPGEAVRAVLAVAVLAAAVGGLPVALWALGRALRPAAGLDLARIGAVLAQPDDGRLLLLALLVIGWAGWAVFTLSVTVEAVAVLRGVPTPRLPLLALPQRGAAALVAAAALLVTPTGGVWSSPPVARPPAASVAGLAVAAPPATPPGPARPTAPPGRGPAPALPDGAAAAEAGGSYPTVLVRRHDTLWSLARTHLGSGERFPEIVALNLGRAQPDGRALTDAHWLFPGWVLRLPSEARTDPPPGPADPVASPPPAEGYTVHGGDSLWKIAAERLGAGSRYGEIYQLNAGRPQPDGGRLTDPDEITPGWRLRLPAAPAPPAAGPGPAPSPPAADGSPRAAPRRSPPPATTGPTPGPTAGASATRSTPRPRSASSGAPAAAPAGQQGGPVAPALVLGLGTVVLTGLGAELRRRRRLQQRLRRPGQRIAMPPEAPAGTAQRAAAAADPVTVQTLRLALRALGGSCREAGRALPDVLLVRVRADAIELVLRAADDAPVDPFRPLDACTWRLDVTPSTQPDEDLPDPFPALVSLGVTEDALILLNLESVGSLTVAGPVAAAEAVLRALAAELAVGPLSEHTALTFVGGFADLAHAVGPGRARFVEDTVAAGRAADVRAEEVRRTLQGSGAAGTRDARARGVASDAWAPEILIAAEPLPARPAAWCGVATVTLGASPGDDGTWVLRAGPDGPARLDPPGIELSAQALTRRDYEHLVTLLVTANPVTGPEDRAQTPGPPPTAADLGRQRAAAFDALPRPPGDVEPGAPSETVPRVLLLGPVYVEGADDESAPGRRRRATELVAYLALHPGASSHQLDEAIWPGRRVAKNTRNPFVSRVRQWLGRTPEGQPYLPLVADGAEYRLRPEVTSDWHDFLRLARTGLARGPDHADDLAAALDLVRGRPFLGIDPATYTWAEPDIQEMISAIVDVAHVLSATRCQLGDHRGAQEAATKGLLVEPCSELLYRDAIRAAAARGDRQEAERLAHRLRYELAALDPDDGIEAETIEAIATATGRQ